MSSRSIRVGCLWLALCSGLFAQFVVVPGALATTTGGVGNLIFNPPPFIIIGGLSATLQIQYPAALLGGIAPGSRISGLSFRLRNVAGTPTSWPPAPGITFPLFEVRFGTSLTPVTSMSTTFSANFFGIVGFGTTETVVRSGPLFMPGGAFTSGATPNAFEFEIPTVPFAYNGGDLVIMIRYSISQLGTAPLELDAYPAGLNGNAMVAGSSTATVGVPTTVPVIRFTTISEFQRNQPAASLDHNGVQSPGNAPAVVDQCTGSTIVVNSASNRIGFPSDIALAFAPLAPRGDAASTPLGDGQVFNVPLGHPSLVFLWSGSSVPAMVPFFPFSLPFTAPGVPVTWCSQAVVIDPTRPSFLALSQGNQVNVAAGVTGTVPGPFQDDTSVTIPLGAQPLCGLNSFAFYGTTYTRLHVSANGRVTFGAPDPSGIPTLAAAAAGRPFVGFWTDLDLVSGTVNVVGTTSSVAVNYSSMTYAAESTTLSFSIVFNANGTLAITGLGTIPPNGLATSGPAGGDAQMLGICNGSLGTSIANAFFPFGSTVTGGNGVGLVDFWPGTAATRPNGLGLVRTIQQNQLAFGQGRLDFTPIGSGYQALNH